MVPQFMQGGYDPCERKTKEFCGHRSLMGAEFLLNRVLSSLLGCLLVVNHPPVFETHLLAAFQSQCDFHLHTPLLKASLSISVGCHRWQRKVNLISTLISSGFLLQPCILCEPFSEPARRLGTCQPAFVPGTVLPYQNLHCPFLQISDVPCGRLNPL